MHFRLLSQNKVRNYQDIGENFIMKIFNIFTTHPTICSGDQITKNATVEDVARVREERCLMALDGETG
jgi:hypothetical protein